jgi:FkbM family methyltransferase
MNRNTNLIFNPIRLVRRKLMNMRFNNPRVLVYCGIHNCENFDKYLQLGYDIAIGIDANPDKVANAKDKYKNDPRVKILHYAITDKTGEQVTFNITEKWDASSSIGEFNPDYIHLHDPKSPLYGTTIRQVTVPTIRLDDLLEQQGVKYLHTLLTDLQGLDLTVLKTVKSWIAQKRIFTVYTEVGKDEFPQIYQDLPSNNRSEFDKLMRGYRVMYELTGPDWWEGDVRWEIDL